MDLSVVIPVFNEEENILPLYNRLKKVLIDLTDAHEIIFVDDGSNDLTADQIMTLRSKDDAVKLVSFSRNFGHEMANSAGFRNAVGKAVVIIDGDLQDPPELIKAMYEKFLSGYDVVYAKRKKRDKEGFFKKASSKMFYRVMRYLSDVELPLDTGDFRLLSRRVVDELNTMDEHNRFFRGLTHWVGFDVTYVEYDRDGRHAGETKYNFFKLMKLAVDAILSFSYKPLKIFSVFGITMSLFSFLFMIYWIVFKIFTDRPIEGWTSTISIFLFFFGILMLQISILGEYIARIYEEVKNRPLYIISKQEGIVEKEASLEKK